MAHTSGVAGRPVRALAGALLVALCAALGLAGWPAPAQAEDLPTFALVFADGRVTPTRLEVPAGKRIKVAISNRGTSAIEFESVQLRKEKVLAPGSDSFVVIAPLDAGEYPFFDDFHPSSAQGHIVAR
jgi:hypothetical protein